MIRKYFALLFVEIGSWGGCLPWRFKGVADGGDGRGLCVIPPSWSAGGLASWSRAVALDGDGRNSAGMRSWWWVRGPTVERTDACRDLSPCFDPDFSAWRRRKLFAGGGVGAVGGAWRDCREMW